jgi:TonB family protein
MKYLTHPGFLFSWIALFAALGAAQQGNSNMRPPSQPKTQAANDDRVYAATEVDVKARITNKMENIPVEGSDCPRQGLVRLRLILHKSGRVTEVTIIRRMACSYDKATVEIARKFKFTPAEKDGQQVSQYQIFEYRYGDQ